MREPGSASSGYVVGRLGKTLQRRKRKAKHSLECPCYVQPELSSHHGCLQGLISSTSYHVVFAFLNPLLIELIQVKYQGMKGSPFKTHPSNIWCFVLSIFIYCFAFAANMKFHSTVYSQLIGLVAILAGSSSTFSLVSILLPCSFGPPAVFIIWALWAVIVARDLIQLLCTCIYRKASTLISKIWSFWNRLLSRRNATERHQLQV